MKTLATGAVALCLYVVFFTVVLAVGAYRSFKNQPSPFEAEEDSE